MVVQQKPGSDNAAYEVQRPRCMCCPRKKAVVIRLSSTGYRPQFYFRTTDVTGCDQVTGRCRDDHAGRQCDHGSCELQIKPIAMEKELRFAIREGGRTVGAGVISEIIE